MKETATILQEILAAKALEIEAAKKILPFDTLKKSFRGTSYKQQDRLGPYGGLINNIKSMNKEGKIAFIAEIKKASPSKGILRENFNPQEIAKIYDKEGAAAISVLTDQKFFQGSLEYLKQVDNVTCLPLLRKDFIIDPYQIYEAKYYGADAILLIVSALNKSQLIELRQCALDLEMNALVEVHNREEMEIALESGADLIGINNRDLHTFQVSLITTFNLLKEYHTKNITWVSESGIKTHDEVKKLYDNGINAILVGETFMKSNNIAESIRKLIK